MIQLIMITWSDIFSGIVSGIISGIVLSIAIKLAYYRRDLPPKITIAPKLSFYGENLKIKFLNEINDPIAIKSSYFIVSYRKDAKKRHGDNYRYKLIIPGEHIPYINAKNDDKKGGKCNEKTYASIVIDAQLIDRRTLENSNVSHTIQDKYFKYREYELLQKSTIGENESDIGKNEKGNDCFARKLSIFDFFEEDEEASITAIIEATNLRNKKTETTFHTYFKNDIDEHPYQKGRILITAESDDG